MNPSVNIGNRWVGTGHDPFIVAEVGINHNGSLPFAFEMIHVAKSAGCDAVKFQTFKAAEFVNDSSQMFTYQSQGKEITESMYEMFQRYELPEYAWSEIKEECDRAGILFLSTPQNEGDLEILLSVGLSAIKVGSDDFTNLPLLRKFSQSGLPMILSCGMSSLSEVNDALEAIGALDGYPTILLVCTSQYPTPREDVNLSRLTTLKNAFSMVPIGFSDHTEGPLASSVATGLGAVFFEKHFTLDRSLPGPDHWFSEDPEGLRNWVQTIRDSYEVCGDSIVRPTQVELKNKNEYQRRLVAANRIERDQLIESSDVALRRVSGGRGLLPKFLDSILGRPSPRTFDEGEPIDFWER